MMAGRPGEEGRNARRNEATSAGPPSSSPPLLRVSLSIETSREYERGLLRGICRYNALHQRWRIDLSPDGTFPQDADGVIMKDHRGSPALLAKGIPIVFVSSLHKNIRRSHRIVSDDRAIGRMAAAHLLERGFRRFAFVGYDGMYWSQQRQESFSQALADEGRACSVFEQARDLRLRVWRKERKVLAAWLKSLERPVGLMACNDDRARQVLDACAMTELGVPQEVAILGVDDDELVCTCANPSISSITLGLEDAGCRAATLLDRLMTAGKGQETCSPTQILVSPVAVTVRQSTDVTAIEDPCVAKALQFIRQNSHRPIQLDDVVRQVAISRRNLSDRFRRTVGCTVHQHIKKTRAARIEALLLNSTLSIGQIAERLGFADSDHIAVYFRSVIGLTPRVCRTGCAHRRRTDCPSGGPIEGMT